MLQIFSPHLYHTVIVSMAVLAVVVFVALQRIEAPYGMAFRSGWGPSLDNRVGWVIMEAPAFLAMLLLLVLSPSPAVPSLAIAGLFLFHYFQRSFIFPCLMRGKSRMPLVITLMGALFNVVNVYLIGGWLFFVAPEGYYRPLASFLAGDMSAFLSSPQPAAFVAGTLIFFVGLAVNWHSDHIVRHLRRPGETGHKIPRGGMYDYVTSANYLGEIIEWAGFALLSWSWAGVVFVVWTCANLVPRAAKLHARYIREFGDEYRQLGRLKIFPFIY